MRGCQKSHFVGSLHIPIYIYTPYTIQHIRILMSMWSFGALNMQAALIRTSLELHICTSPELVSARKLLRNTK